MYFNGTTKDYVRVHYELIKPYWAPIKNELVTVPGMAGAYLMDTKKEVLYIDVPLTVSKGTFNSLDLAKEDMADWLVTDEPKELSFSSDRVYYAKLDGSFEVSKKMIDAEKGILTFVCPDPLKYGQEDEVTFTDSVLINQVGNEATKPVFDITVQEPVTHIDVVRGDGKYMRLGSPVEADETVFDRTTLIMHDTCDTVVGWGTPTYVDNGEITGTMGASAGGFIATDFGADEPTPCWQGPSIKKSFPEPLGNFQLDVLVENINAAAQTGMIEVYLLDASNNTVAKIGLEDVWKSLQKIQAKMQLGNLGDPDEIDYYAEAKYDYGWNNFDGIIRLYRDDFSGEQRIRPHFAIVEPNGRQTWVSREYVYKDVLSNHQEPVTQIQIAIRKFTGTTATDMKVKDIKAWRFNVNTGIPYLAQAGDVFTIDHKHGSILLNGEDIRTKKHFGASYFDLPPGSTNIYTYPQGALNTTVKWRPAYK